MSDTSTDKIMVTCGCGASLRVGRGAIGKRGRCPKCQDVFVVKDPDETTPMGGDDEFDLLAQAVAEQSKAPAVPQSERTAPALKCPACGAAMSPNSLLCIECGHNLQTGQSATGVSPVVPKDGMLRRVAGSAGPFLLGCGLSTVGALVGAALWLVIALWFGIESGFIAWGLGGLAGLGMVMGYPERNQKAGFAAAGIALFGIGLAKIAIVVFVISVMITGNTDNVEIQKSILASVMADEELDANEVWDEEEREVLWDEAYDRAWSEVERMPASAFNRKWQEYRDDLDFENAFEDEFGPKRMRVAHWEADRKADADGVPYGSRIREGMYKEAFRTVKTYSDEQLAQAVADIDAWEARDKSEDEDYVRTQLIYALTNEEVQKRNEGRDEYWEPTDLDWKTMFDIEAANVDAMSPEERLTAWKAREAEVEREGKIEKVVEHDVYRRTLREGISFDDERWEAISKEATEQCEAMSPEELDARIAEIEAWNDGGMWEDTEYLRDRLIDQHISDAVSQRAQGPGFSGVLSTEERDKYRADAIAFVDSVPPEEYRRHLEERQQALREKWMANLADRESEESAEAVGALAAMFLGMFGPIDLIFIGLALLTAYRMGTGTGGE